MTSFLIVDAQSVKNTDSAEQKGYTSLSIRRVFRMPLPSPRPR
jgi:hypothetical protein